MDYQIKKLNLISYGCLLAGVLSFIIFREAFYLVICLGFIYFRKLSKLLKEEYENGNYEAIPVTVSKIYNEGIATKAANRLLNHCTVDFFTEDGAVLTLRLMQKDIFRKLVKEPEVMEGFSYILYFRTEDPSLSLQDRFVTLELQKRISL